ncbi:HERC2, partial [Symbiodinium microadriaticum]
DPVGAVETKPNKANHDDTSDDDMDDDDEARKLKNRMDTFLRKVETYKDTLRYRDEGTDGGFYSRDDMIKKVPDGGLGWSAKYADKVIAWCQANPNGNIRKNKYDDELEEYWCDKRTSGRQGLSEKAKDQVHHYMKECVAARDKMMKFVDKLDPTDAAVKLLLSYNQMVYLSSSFLLKSSANNLRELPKLNDIKDSLGKLYDELAALQAEAKIGNMQNEKLEKVFENVKKQHLCCNPPLK